MYFLAIASCILVFCLKAVYSKTFNCSNIQEYDLLYTFTDRAKLDTSSNTSYKFKQSCRNGKSDSSWYLIPTVSRRYCFKSQCPSRQERKGNGSGSGDGSEGNMGLEISVLYFS